MKSSRLTLPESLTLDVVRISASILVAFGHFTQSPFSTGWPNLTDNASSSVAAFFILSGFVIRYVTTTRETTLRVYAIDRASRIYSVTLPAFLVVILLDPLSHWKNPALYANFVGQPIHAVSSLFLNLIFCGQLWNHLVYPLTAGPFWSVNYEVAYYVLYGCLFYLTGWTRFAWALVFALILGPHILLFLPLWYFGCIAYDLYTRWNEAGTASKNLDRILLAAVASAAFYYLPPVRPHAQPLLLHFKSTADYVLSGEKLSSHNVLIGVVGTLVTLRFMAAIRNLAMDPKSTSVRIVRFVSEGTFPLYLLHLPVLVFLGAWLPYNHASPWQKSAVFTFVLALGILAGEPGNIFKLKLRAWFLSHPLRRAAILVHPNLSRLFPLSRSK